jgi:xylulokinase
MNPLYNAVLGMDYRSIEQSRKCSELFGDEELFRKTGMRPHPMNSLTKILWFKESLPHVFEKTYKFFTYADYINVRLGAEPCIDYSMASRTMAFDILEKKWSDRILSKLSIDLGYLSKPVACGKVIGQISHAVADEIGISKKALLVSGGHDQACAAIGAGIVNAFRRNECPRIEQNDV